MKTQQWNILDGEGEFVSSYAPVEKELSALEENASLMVDGRHQILQKNITLNDEPLSVVLKSFAKQAGWKDGYDYKHGSKASRSFKTAVRLVEHGVGTPAPIAYADFWEGDSLSKSYYISEELETHQSFKEALCELYHQKVVQSDELMRLLILVSTAVKKMHDAGVMHRDLGNQNILLLPEGDKKWASVSFIDLNRARQQPYLSLRQRANDLVRISLPSDLRRLFIDMYWAPDVQPKGFQKLESYCRVPFALHTLSRNVRHPIREVKKKRQLSDELEYPSYKEIWIWDEKSVQAISPMRSLSRIPYMPISSHVDLTWHYLRSKFSISTKFKQEMKDAYTRPVKMEGGAAVCLEARAETAELEKHYLEELGKVPVLVRFYHHEEEDRWEFTSSFIHDLHSMGHAVTIALVQDREALRNLDSWETFVRTILSRVSEVVDYVEIGHAINRVKWGIWGVGEYRSLVKVVHEVAKDFKGIKFIGPAIIDFEAHYAPGTLAGYPKDFRFSAISQHLYVDRRGAPENKQGAYSTLEKIALLKASANWSDHCDDKVIISEMNWPIKGTGEYSPVCSPYETPGFRENDPSIDEDSCADFYIRYLLVAVCSGMVDRLYWWKLAAHGFGLIDDRAEGGWRPRPAFEVLKQYLKRVEPMTFIRLQKLDDGVMRFYFGSEESKEELLLTYTSLNEAISVKMPSSAIRIEDAFGEELPFPGAKLKISGRPVYVYLEANE